MIYSANAIAKFIIRFCNNERIPITNLYLQKLLYFIQAEYIVTQNAPCFSDDMEAWDFGPIIPDIYDHYCAYGSKSIPFFKTDAQPDIDDHDEVTIVSILKKYTKYGNDYLIRLAYEQIPWKNAHSRSINNVIKLNEIKKYNIITERTIYNG